MSFNPGAPDFEPLERAQVNSWDKIGQSLWSKGTKLLFSLWILAQVGCCCFNADPSRHRLVDEAFVRYRDCVWANRAYNLEYGHTRRPLADHFRKGYVAGYMDVSRGGSGYVPAVPPSDYMNYEYQSAEGSSCVSAWFEGFPAGAKAAKSRNLDQYANAYVSGTMQEALRQDSREVKLPSEIQILSGHSHDDSIERSFQGPQLRQGQVFGSDEAYQYR